MIQISKFQEIQLGIGIFEKYTKSQFLAKLQIKVTSSVFQVQGAILVAAILQVTVGLTGIMGYLLKFVGPLCIAPTITLVGLALFEEATYFAQQNWAVSVM